MVHLLFGFAVEYFINIQLRPAHGVAVLKYDFETVSDLRVFNYFEVHTCRF